MKTKGKSFFFGYPVQVEHHALHQAVKPEPKDKPLTKQQFELIVARFTGAELHDEPNITPGSEAWSFTR